MRLVLFKLTGLSAWLRSLHDGALAQASHLAVSVRRGGEAVWETVTWPLRVLRQIQRAWRLWGNVQPLIERFEDVDLSGLADIDVAALLQAMKTLNPDDLAALPDLIAVGRAFSPIAPGSVASSRDVAFTDLLPAPAPDPSWLAPLNTQLQRVSAALLTVAEKLERMSHGPA